MKKYIGYFSEKIPSEINFNKLGIVIRKISVEEINYILKDVSSTFLSDKMQDVSNLYVKYDKNELNKEEKLKYFEMFGALNKLEKHSVIFLGDLIKGGELINKRYFRNIIKELTIIEIDNSKFDELFANGNEEKIVKSILHFSNYIKKENYTFYVKLLEYYKPNKEEFFVYYYQLFQKEKCSISYENLKKTENLLNKSDKIFNFNFISIIDLLLNGDSVIENIIVNKVSILERILIGKNDDKEKQFVLKTGMVCSEFIKDIPREKISKILHTIYEVRSLIVHGDDYKIVEEIEKFKIVFGNIKVYDNKWETKRNILAFVNSWLTLFLQEVFRKYLDNSEIIKYIKEN